MSKATKPRKPAKDNRKRAAAAKRPAAKSSPRKVRAKGASQRLTHRPAAKRSRTAMPVKPARTTQVAEAEAPEAPRTPPPLPVPIASFTF
jgi:hypothetical protein